MNFKEMKKAVKEFPAAFKAGIKTYRIHTGVKSGAVRGADVLLDLCVVADIHTDADSLRDRTNTLRLAFSGIEYNFSPDALIMAGDITNSAHIKEYALLKKLCSAYIKNTAILPQMGNHDTRATSIYPYYGEAKELFLDFCSFCGVETEKVYYSTEINGYRMIVMGGEDLAGNTDEAYISEEQLKWLDTELTKAEDAGKPVFVINHQPPNTCNGVPEICPKGGVGKQSEQLEAILSGHSGKIKIVYISGHLHKEDSRYAYMKKDGVIYLNLSSFEYQKGHGYRIRVTENEMKFVPFDFIENGKYADIITEEI